MKAGLVSKILDYVSQIIALIGMLVSLVEKQGGGEEKKAEVIAKFKEIVSALESEGVFPSWLARIFVIDTVVGTIIDIIVSIANKTGFFNKTGVA